MVHGAVDQRRFTTLPGKDYPKNLMKLSLIENQQRGDRWTSNPLIPNFHELVRIISVQEIPVDERLV
jgi:hypothetical protein